MSDPFDVLGINADSDDETIRRRYLELVRQFSPEHHPEKFAAVRAAYEHLRDLKTRLKARFFGGGKHETLDVLIEELSCRRERPRIPLKTLIENVMRP